MAKKVLSAVAVDAEQTELQEFDLPDIPLDAGLLKVEAAGVCGSDWPAYLKKSPEPRILGHENVGFIAARSPSLTPQRTAAILPTLADTAHPRIRKIAQSKFPCATDLTMSTREVFL